MKLNLGCGLDIQDGFVNCDIHKHKGVDKVFDLDYGFPIKNNVCDEIKAFKVIEHLHNPKNMVDEIWRVCKNKAVVRILAPHTSNVSMYGCLGHFRAGINSLSFNQYLENNKGNYNKQQRFRIIKYEYILPPITSKTGFWALVRRRIVKPLNSTLQVFLRNNQRFTEIWLSKWVNLGNFYIELEVVK